MANMSYCRFENTEIDLRDCLRALEDCEGSLDDLSEDEQRAAKRLIRLCGDISENHGDLLAEPDGKDPNEFNPARKSSRPA